MNSKLVLVDGCVGQDGSNLCKFLLDKEYDVIGLHRRYSTPNYWRLDELGIRNHKRLILKEGDICDNHFMTQFIMRYKFSEIYHTAAMSHVGSSFECPDYTMEVNGNSVIGILEAIRLYSPETRFYQCSTSELWGNNYTEINGRKVQNELTQFSPTSPYSVSKMAAHYAVKLYREAYGIFAVAGILHNHDGPLRGDNFLTRKVSKYVAQLVKDCGPEPCSIGERIPGFVFYENILREYPKLKLGNLNSIRDIGDSREYVEAMWLMLQQKTPKDYVIGTGIGTKMSDFVKWCFEVVGIYDWENYVEIDKSLFRASEVNHLCADASLAEKELGWKPKTTAKELAKIMVEADLRRVGL